MAKKNWKSFLQWPYLVWMRFQSQSSKCLFNYPPVRVGGTLIYNLEHLAKLIEFVVFQQGCHFGGQPKCTDTSCRVITIFGLRLFKFVGKCSKSEKSAAWWKSRLKLDPAKTHFVAIGRLFFLSYSAMVAAAAYPSGKLHRHGLCQAFLFSNSNAEKKSWSEQDSHENKNNES